MLRSIKILMIVGVAFFVLVAFQIITKNNPMPITQPIVATRAPVVPATTAELKWEASKAGKLYLKHLRDLRWTREICEAVAAHRILIGMDAEQVVVAWGCPYKINRTSFSSLQREQWIVREAGDTYLYFDNGILTTVQDSR